MADPGDKDQNDLVEEALGIELILLEVFKHLPVQTLLTCRFVNQKWNSLIVRLLRDHRECPVIIPADKACERLQALEREIPEIIQRASEDGVPYNGLKINLCRSEETGCHVVHSERKKSREIYTQLLEERRRREAAGEEDPLGDDNEESQPKWPNILSLLSPKFVSINGFSYHRYCSWYLCSLILSLLREKCGEIISMEFSQDGHEQCREFSYLRNHMHRRGQVDRPIFERLEVIKIGDIVNFQRLFNLKEFLALIIRDAPNIRTIQGKCVSSVSGGAVIPAESYKLIDSFVFHPGSGDGGLGLSLQVAIRRPALRYFSIRTTEMEPSEERLQKCQVIVEELLQSSRGSLKELFVQSNISLAQLALLPQQPFVKLVKLIVKINGPTSELWELIKSTDFGRLFPRVNELHLEVVGEVVPMPENPFPPSDGTGQEEVNDNQSVGQQPSRARKLVLLCDVTKVNFLHLHSMFPALRSLTLPACYGNTIPDVKIFELWPELEELHTFEGANGAVPLH